VQDGLDGVSLMAQWLIAVAALGTWWLFQAKAQLDSIVPTMASALVVVSLFRALLWISSFHCSLLPPGENLDPRSGGGDASAPLSSCGVALESNSTVELWVCVLLLGLFVLDGDTLVKSSWWWGLGEGSPESVDARAASSIEGKESSYEHPLKTLV
jgi:hypothetical protein